MITKRPQTSSVSYSLDAKMKGRSTHHFDNQTLPQLPDKIKKWQQVSKQINRQLQLYKYASQAYSSHQSLQKFGSNSFSLSQYNNQLNMPKLVRPVTTTKQYDSIKQIKTLQNYRNADKQKKTIKRVSRPFPQNKFNNSYDRPVLSIGFHMQSEQKFVKFHIENIKKVQIIQPPPLSIIFSIKNDQQVYNACTTTLRNKDMPICISLFAQSFDAKVQQSAKKKRQYFEKMLRTMNGTYDPEIMSRMKIINKKKSFNQKQYFAYLFKFKTQLKQNQQKQISKIICKILKNNSQQQNQSIFIKLREQIIQNYIQGNAITNLDYHLKNQSNLRQMNMMRQYLSAKKQSIASFRIIYHGGYSKTLYKGWKNYVDNSKSQLPKKIFNFNNYVQSVNSWIQQFDQLNLIESYLFQVLIEPITLQQMKTLQMFKINQIFGIFSHICIKGIFSILQFNRLLFKQSIQIKQLISPIKKIQYLVSRNQSIQNIHLINVSNDIQLIKWFSTFLQLRHKKKRIKYIEDLVQIIQFQNQAALGDYEKKKINKSIQILVNIFYSKIVQRSLGSLAKLFTQNTKPFLKLSLIVDRQSLKLQQTQQKVLETFTVLISEILKKKFNYSSTGMHIEQEQDNDNLYKQFGNLILIEKQRQTVRSDFCWEMKIQYRNIGINDYKLQNLLSKVKQWYHQSQMIIQHFSNFMPFIKLTAKQKIFAQQPHVPGKSEWDQSKDMFISNKQKIKLYRQKLSQIPNKINIGIFQIDCSEPIKILRDRISQIEYLLQQKYLSRIFQQIPDMEQQLAKIKSTLHSCNIKVSTSEDIANIFEQARLQVYDIKKRTSQLAKHVYFYVEKQSKSSMVINRFMQLINKRKLLLAEMDELKQRIKQETYYLEIKREEQELKYQKQIIIYQKKFDNFYRQYIEVAKLDKYLVSLRVLMEQFSQFRKQFNQIKDPNYQYQSEQVLFEDTSKRIEIVYGYWSNVNNFNSILKQLSRCKVRNLEMNDYQIIVQSSLKAIQKFQSLDIETNEINANFYIKFREEVHKHKNNLEYLRILTNQNIPMEYFASFECQDLLSTPFKQISNNKTIQNYKNKLKQLQIKAKSQQNIYNKYIQIKMKFQSLKLTIVDFYGCDTLDAHISKELAETLRQNCFECQKLLLFKYSDKYNTKIKELYKNMQFSQQIVLKWLQVETKFLQLQAFYRNNQQAYFREQFKSISQSHRKIIKSFDMDNSVILLPSSSFLLNSLDSIRRSLQKLKGQIFQKFNVLQSSFCRLQLLSHEQLLEMTSNIFRIPKHLPQCLPSIQNISLSDQSIDRVGGVVVNSNNEDNSKFKQIATVIGNYIQLAEPISLGSRLVCIEVWFQKLLVDIKNSLKYMFLIPNKRQCCLQIIILKQQIQFTQQVEQILCSQEEIAKKLQNYSRSLVARMEQKRKSDMQKYNKQMVLLLLIMERDVITSLIQATESGLLTKDSFEWLKSTRFYNNTQGEGKKISKIDVTMSVVNQSYNYNFMFIEKCDMIVHDALFIGNCVVGVRGSGKKSIIKNYAYLTGNQIFIFQENRISNNFIQNIVNYYKLAITTGSWLLISDINLMNSQQLRVIAQCLNSMNQAILAKQSQMQMFVYHKFCVNQNSKAFFTLQNFHLIPSRLSHNFRPIWMIMPSVEFINSIYIQATNMTEAQVPKHLVEYLGKQNTNYTFKIIDFIYWNRQNQDVPLCLAQSMLRKAQNNIKKFPSQIPNQTLSFLTNNKFLMPEDLGRQYEGEQSVDWILQNSQQSIFYLPSTQMINFIGNNFCQQNSICISLKQTNYLLIKQKFNYIRERIRSNSISHILFQDCLNSHRLIRKQIKDYFVTKNNIKIIYIQNINNFRNDQNLRIETNFPTIIIKSLKISVISNKQNQLKTKKIGFKSAYLNTDQIIELDVISIKIVENLTKKYMKYKITEQQIDEIVGWFCKMRTKMIKAGYCKEVSLVFALGWIFGSYLSQKNIIQEMVGIGSQFMFYKLLTKCNNLRELYPTKNGLVSSSDYLQQVHTLKFSEGDFHFKSIVLSNVKKIYQLFKDELIIIKCQLSAQQIVNILFPDSHHIYPIDMESPVQSKNKFEHILKMRQNGEKNHFVIHSIQKFDTNTFMFLNQFSQKSSAFYLEMGELKSFRQAKCQFTFVTSKDLPIGYGNLTLNLNNDEIIANQLDILQSVMKRSSLIGQFDYAIIKGVTNSYEQSLTKYYWFQQPIRQALKKYLASKQSEQPFYMWLLRYRFLSVPSQKMKLINNICYSSAPTSIVKDQQTEYQIKMSSLIQTNTFLEQTLNQSQIQIRKNICRDVIVLNNFNATPYNYEMLYKTFLAISNSHTILMGATYTQRLYCLEMAAKIMNLEIVPFNKKLFLQCNNKKISTKCIAILKQVNLSDQALTVLQSLVCQQQQFINKNWIVVVKMNSQNPETAQWYKKYPFLRKYFLHVYFPQNCKDQISQNLNLVKTLKNLQLGQNKHQAFLFNDWEIPPQLQVQKNINQYFESHLQKNIGFLVKLLQLRRQIQEQQFNKYRFYRALTEQLFYILSKLNYELMSIPDKLNQVKKKQQQLTLFNEQVMKDYKLAEKQVNQLSTQLKSLKQILNEKTNLFQSNQQKLNINEDQSKQTFSKIYIKLDNLGIQDHSKFKLTTDNDFVNLIYNFIANLIKWENGKLKKVPSNKLSSIVSQQHIKLEKQKQIIKKIIINWKNNKKKYQKIGTIFHVLIQWILAVENYVFKILDENMKLKQIMEQLKNQLMELKFKISQTQQKLKIKTDQFETCQKIIQSNKCDSHQIKERISLIKQREGRISKILKQVIDKEYKIKISKDLAERLYFIPKIIMSKSICQIGLNEFEDDHFIAKQLFLKSAKQEQSKEVKDSQLFKYGIALSHNIFEDYDSVFDTYTKYKLAEMDYDQVKLLHTIIYNKYRVQLIEDGYEIISHKLIDICGNQLDYKVLNLCDATLDNIKREIQQKSNSYNKIFIILSRFDLESQIKKLSSIILQNISIHDNLRMVLLFKKFQPVYQTDSFRSISDGKICITFRRYLKQFAKIVQQKQFTNEWEYYHSQYDFNKSHKMLFQVVEGFHPEQEQSYNRISQVIKKLQQARVRKITHYQNFQEYFQFLTNLSQPFGSFFILLKFLESIDRHNVIQLFQGGNLFKNYQLALKIAAAQMYGIQKKDYTDLLRKFIVYISNLINFVNYEQMSQYCMIAAFLLSKPASISPYFIMKLLRQGQKCKKQSERIKYLIKQVSGQDYSLSDLQQRLATKNIQNLCAQWLQYLILATSPHYRSYTQNFMLKMKYSVEASVIMEIKQRNSSLDLHYYLSKSKMEFKNEFKVSVATFRQRACKIFWIVKVKKQNSQKFMEVLQNRVSSLKQQIKIVNFFFNERKYEGNFQKLKSLSERKMFVCIFNLTKESNNVADQIITNLLRNKNMNPLFKLFILSQDAIQIKNRQHIDFIQFVSPDRPSQQKNQKNIQQQVTKILNNLVDVKSIKQNLNIISSLNVIIEKLSNKMFVQKQKDKIYKFLLPQLLNQNILKKQGNALKFLVQYFKASKVENQDILDFCKIKQPLLVFQQIKPSQLKKLKQQYASNETLPKWINLLEKIESSTIIQGKYKTVLKVEINKLIQCLIKVNNARIIISETQLKNIVKYGWLIIQNAESLKFLIYKGLKQGLKDSCYEDSYETVRQLKIVGQKKGKKIGLRLDEFNELFDSQRIVQQHELKIKAIQEHHQQSLLQKSELQSILQHYNIRMSLCEEKDTLGTLYVTYK